MKIYNPKTGNTLSFSKKEGEAIMNGHYGKQLKVLDSKEEKEIKPVVGNNSGNSQNN